MDSLDPRPMQNLIDHLRSEFLAIWPCRTLTFSPNPVLSVSQFYEDACLPPHCADREHRSNFIGSDLMLRRELADSMPEVLRTLAQNPLDEMLLICPGPVYQRDKEERLHARHELEIWRLVSEDVALDSLDEIVLIVQQVLPAGFSVRTVPGERPYLVYGFRMEVHHEGTWMRIGHCGLINPMLLIENGFDSAYANGLALNLDLDFCLKLLTRSSCDEEGSPFRRSRKGCPKRYYLGV